MAAVEPGAPAPAPARSVVPPRPRRAPKPRAGAAVPQPRAVLAGVQRPRPPRGPRRAQSAARAHPVPGHLRRQPRRVLPGPHRRPAPADRGRRRSPARRTDGPRWSSSSPPGLASWSSSPTTPRSSATLRAALAAEGIEIVDYDEIPEHHDALRQRFLDEIYPVLTPLAVDPGHPFPYISTLSLSIAVGLRDPGYRRARLRPRQGAPDPAALLEIEPNHFIPIDQVIEANLADLFLGHGGRGEPPVPGHPQRRLHGRGGRGGRPAHGHRGGAPPAPLRRGGATRGRAHDAGRRRGTS